MNLTKLLILLKLVFTTFQNLSRACSSAVMQATQRHWNRKKNIFSRHIIGNWIKMANSNKIYNFVFFVLSKLYIFFLCEKGDNLQLHLQFLCKQKLLVKQDGAKVMFGLYIVFDLFCFFYFCVLSLFFSNSFIVRLKLL